MPSSNRARETTSMSSDYPGSINNGVFNYFLWRCLKSNVLDIDNTANPPSAEEDDDNEEKAVKSKTHSALSQGTSGRLSNAWAIIRL